MPILLPPWGSGSRTGCDEPAGLPRTGPQHTGWGTAPAGLPAYWHLTAWSHQTSHPMSGPQEVVPVQALLHKATLPPGWPHLLTTPADISIHSEEWHSSSLYVSSSHQ